MLYLIFQTSTDYHTGDILFAAVFGTFQNIFQYISYRRSKIFSLLLYLELFLNISHYISYRRSKIFSLSLYLELSIKHFPLYLTGDQRYSLSCCISYFPKYFPLYLVQEIKDGKLGAFIWDSSRLEFEAAR